MNLNDVIDIYNNCPNPSPSTSTTTAHTGKR